MQANESTIRVVSKAPGKLVVLGEYAVLNGAPALVLAVDRYCCATIGPSEDGSCHFVSMTNTEEAVDFSADMRSGFAVVDEVLQSLPNAGIWQGMLDSRELFAATMKLGLGSSAAALTAWAGAWAVFSGRERLGADSRTLEMLIGLHQAIQSGTGSGVDVAASLFGGVIRFQLNENSLPEVSTVQLPKGVGFAGIFARSAALTPDFLARYEAWCAAKTEEAVALQAVLAEIAQNGICAASEDDAQGFLEAITEYGRCLEYLGVCIGAHIVTPKHRELMKTAERLGIAYKVSGAGGGDFGLAFSADAVALDSFKRAVDAECDVFEFGIDPSGLIVETASE